MLRLFNSLGKKLQPFRPVNPACVNIFTCGPSVYQRSHIGNFRTFLFEDILVRYLRYAGYEVKRGMNFTDIEDKAVAEARKERKSLKSLTEANIGKFLEESKLLNIRKPDYLPRASDSISRAVQIVEVLLKKDRAYRYGDDFYFDPLSFPGFGKIYGLDMSKWPKKKVRFSRDTYPGMRWNLGDFILWHGCRAREIECWESKIGPGRPAWNIQDASMVDRYFTETLSIYCGGIDNLIRHHDYTLAILESVRPYPMARFWLHCQHLYVEGRKMSKSQGNILYTDDLLNRGYTPAEIRFFLIYNHYRERINFTERNMRRAAAVLNAFKEKVRSLEQRTGSKPRKNLPPTARLSKVFKQKMDDDLNVKQACDSLLSALSDFRAEKLKPEDAASALIAIREIDWVLGVLF